MIVLHVVELAHLGTPSRSHILCAAWACVFCADTHMCILIFHTLLKLVAHFWYELTLEELLHW